MRFTLGAMPRKVWKSIDPAELALAADNARYGLAVTIMIVGAAANEILTIHDP